VAIIGAVMMIAIPKQHSTSLMAGYALVFFYPVGFASGLSLGSRRCSKSIADPPNGMWVACQVASPFYYSWLSSCVGGSSKKICFNVFLQIGYCVGNIIGGCTRAETWASPRDVSPF
jgi:hypothetical protein